MGKNTPWMASSLWQIFRYTFARRTQWMLESAIGHRNMNQSLYFDEQQKLLHSARTRILPETEQYPRNRIEFFGYFKKTLHGHLRLVSLSHTIPICKRVVHLFSRYGRSAECEKRSHCVRKFFRLILYAIYFLKEQTTLRRITVLTLNCAQLPPYALWKWGLLDGAVDATRPELRCV